MSDNEEKDLSVEYVEEEDNAYIDEYLDEINNQEEGEDNEMEVEEGIFNLL